MAHPEINFHKLVEAYSQLLEVANIETPAARLMAFFEVFTGVTLLASLALLYFHELVLAALAFFNDQGVPHGNPTPFYLSTMTIILSLVLVALREFWRK